MVIPAEIRRELEAHAADDAPNEACGLVVLREGRAVRYERGRNAAGKKVTMLKPGTYAFVITDKASIHDWNLVGPGVNKTSGVAFVGKKTIVATLKRGSYKYQCSVHFFKGTFKVV